MVFFTCTSEQHIYEIGDTVLSKRSHHILTWPLTQYSETELGLYEVLHHRAKSCKWVFNKSIFSFKGGVELGLTTPGIFYLLDHIFQTFKTNTASNDFLCMWSKSTLVVDWWWPNLAEWVFTVPCWYLVCRPPLNEKIDSGNTHLQDLARWWRTSKAKAKSKAHSGQYFDLFWPSLTPPANPVNFFWFKMACTCVPHIVLHVSCWTRTSGAGPAPRTLKNNLSANFGG